MIEHEDRMFADFLREGPERGPADGPAHVFDRTRTMRQRPAWTFVVGWQGLGRRQQRLLVPALAILALLLLALAAVLFIGSTRHRTTPLTGPARNGVIAYDTGVGGRIYLTDPDGKNPRVIDGAHPIQRSPTFSPDGTRIAFWSRPDQEPGTPLELWVANADGTGARLVSGGMRLDVNVYTTPSWSPDGQDLVFDSMDHGVSRLFVAKADGSRPVKALTGRDAWRGGEIYSPDGQWIAFHKLTPAPGGRSSFSIMRPDGSDERDLWTQPDPPQGGFDNGPNWAPNSKGILLARLGSMSGINGESPQHSYLEWRDLEGNNHPIYEDPREGIGWPSWSPDDNWIVFGEGEGFTRPFLIHPDGTGLIALPAIPRDAQVDCSFHWAPDAQSFSSVCSDDLRFFVSDPAHPVRMALPAGSTGWDQQRLPFP